MPFKHALLSAVLIVFADPAMTMAADQPQVIAVSGTGEVGVEPDEVVLTMRVEKFDRDLQVAKRMNDDSVENILALTRRFSIPARDVQTNQVSMDIVRDPPPKLSGAMDDGLRRTGALRGYLVSKTIVVKLGDIERFEPFYAEILTTGVSEVANIELGTSRLREHRDIARTMAMKAAREKAVAMTAAIGQTIGKAVQVTEDDAASMRIYNMSANSSSSVDGFSGDTARFAPGAIKIKASVKVSFELN